MYTNFICCHNYSECLCTKNAYLNGNNDEYDQHLLSQNRYGMRYYYHSTDTSHFIAIKNENGQVNSNNIINLNSQRLKLHDVVKIVIDLKECYISFYKNLTFLGKHDLTENQTYFRVVSLCGCRYHKIQTW